MSDADFIALNVIALSRCYNLRMLRLLDAYNKSINPHLLRVYTNSNGPKWIELPKVTAQAFPQDTYVTTAQVRPVFNRSAQAAASPVLNRSVVGRDSTELVFLLVFRRVWFRLIHSGVPIGSRRRPLGSTAGGGGPNRPNRRTRHSTPAAPGRCRPRTSRRHLRTGGTLRGGRAAPAWTNHEATIVSCQLTVVADCPAQRSCSGVEDLYTAIIRFVSSMFFYKTKTSLNLQHHSSRRLSDQMLRSKSEGPCRRKGESG
eukprot:1177262-Prorocentrum_minimum.AAC.3